MGQNVFYLPCWECFGHGTNPSANPLCKFGCGRYYTGPIPTTKPQINIQSTGPSILIKKTKLKTLPKGQPVTQSNGRPVHLVPSLNKEKTSLIVIMACLLIICFIAIGCRINGRKRMQRVSSFLETPAFNQYEP